MKVQAVKCSLCGATVFSRATHDFRYCPCGADKHGSPRGVSIDGGRAYAHVGWNNKKIKAPEVIFITIKQTKKQIIEDYLYSENKYGIIEGLKGNGLML
jgi:hypothetical protein